MTDVLRTFSEVFLPIIIVAVGYALQADFPLDIRSFNHVSLYALKPRAFVCDTAADTDTGNKAVRLVLQMASVVVAMNASA